jgi:hypothetical protein
MALLDMLYERRSSISCLACAAHLRSRGSWHGRPACPERCWSPGSSARSRNGRRRWTDAHRRQQRSTDHFRTRKATCISRPSLVHRWSACCTEASGACRTAGTR